MPLAALAEKPNDIQVANRSLDLDQDGKLEIQLSRVKAGKETLVSHLRNKKDKVSFLKTYVDGKVNVIFADLNNDGIFEKMALLNDREEVYAVFKINRDGQLEKEPLENSKLLWPF